MPTFPATFYLCRAGLEPALRSELLARDPRLRDATPSGARGYVAVAHAAYAPPAPAAIFEHQRIPRAERIPPKALNPISEATERAVLGTLAAAAGSWTLHAYAACPDADPGAARRARGFADALLRACGRRWPELSARRQDGAAAWVLQLCLTPDGMWYGACPAGDLPCARPGGVFRMRLDADAPSRSYLKLEEAWLRMGAAPQPGDTAVDLGAAPGGWTYALARRGCRVLAVDNGPLRLRGEFPGSVRHLREDGLPFSPPRDFRPVDWLVSDMLIPPGKTLGLLRRWTQHAWMRHVVCTVKLPQQDPYPAIQPLIEWMRQLPRLQAELRHLYHDRREITLFGSFKED
jgi:23S rRNA C2498 (ribose-2'-O)-methylase RlmM